MYNTVDLDDSTIKNEKSGTLRENHEWNFRRNVRKGTVDKKAVALDSKLLFRFLKATKKKKKRIRR